MTLTKSSAFALLRNFCVKSYPAFFWQDFCFVSFSNLCIKSYPASLLVSVSFTNLRIKSYPAFSGGFWLRFFHYHAISTIHVYFLYALTYKLLLYTEQMLWQWRDFNSCRVVVKVDSIRATSEIGNSQYCVGINVIRTSPPRVGLSPPPPHPQ